MSPDDLLSLAVNLCWPPFSQFESTFLPLTAIRRNAEDEANMISGAKITEGFFMQCALIAAARPYYT